MIFFVLMACSVDGNLFYQGFQSSSFFTGRDDGIFLFLYKKIPWKSSTVKKQMWRNMHESIRFTAEP
jgi:hypothetical protein